MKWVSLFSAGTCMIALLLVAFSPVRGDSPRTGPAPTGRVTIDGRAFLPGDPGQGDPSTLRRAFEQFGVEVPEELWVSAGGRGQHPAFQGSLVGAEVPPSGDPPGIPNGLTAEHTIRLESATGPVDLILGKMNIRGTSIRTRLTADGWVGHEQGDATGSPWFLEKRTGKETTIACLDEAEGTFLLIRGGGR